MTKYAANYSQGSMPFAVVGTHPTFGQMYYRYSRHHSLKAARAAAKKRGGDARVVRQCSGGDYAWEDA